MNYNIIIILIVLLIFFVSLYIFEYKKCIEKFESYESLPTNVKKDLSDKISGITNKNDKTTIVSKVENIPINKPTNNKPISNKPNSNTSTTNKPASKSKINETEICKNYIHKKDLDKYILKTEIPKLNNIDLNKYILKTEIKPGDMIDMSKYILKSSITSDNNIDLSKYILKSEIDTDNKIILPINTNTELKPDINVSDIKDISKLSTCLDISNKKDDIKTENLKKINDTNVINKPSDTKAKKDESIHINDIKPPRPTANVVNFEMKIPKLNYVELPVINQVENKNKVINKENEFIFPSLGTLANPIQLNMLELPTGCVKSRRVIANRDAFVAY